MKSEHDESVAAWFSTLRPLPDTEFTGAVMQRVRASRLRLRACSVGVVVFLLVLSGWLWPTLSSRAGSGLRQTFDGLTVLGAGLASPLAWLLCVIACAALWPVIRLRQ